ncbi:4Fe-4S binding protein [Sporomusa sp.]|uniref:4Fe-4S binding protein n=1 Tax=Sporomusa sp. TaxID=2078658 RepID=UPI002CA4DB1C|nr:4Fe-4S binding protein [Sporomusa sp.]HWR10095.1 4Fe-4S binding protein [Sporomusa sp.]
MHNATRQHGKIDQQQPGFSAIRIRTIAGNLTSDQFHKLAELSVKYGRGQLHITTRQSVEIHWVQENQLDLVFKEIHDFGLLLAVRGARVLTVIACPGIRLCKRGIGDTIMLTTQLNDLIVGQELAGKTKIAVSGCPSSCAKPQINDIGLHGVAIPAVTSGCVGCNCCIQGCKVAAMEVRGFMPHIDMNKCVGCGTCVKNCPQQALRAEKQGYAVYVGGKIGKQPMLGTRIFAVIPEQEAISYVQAILDVYKRLGLKGERIGDVIDRIGVAAFQQEISMTKSSVTLP